MNRDPRQDPRPGDVIKDRVSRVVIFEADEVEVGFRRSTDDGKRISAERWLPRSAWPELMGGAEVVHVA